MTDTPEQARIRAALAVGKVARNPLDPTDKRRKKGTAMTTVNFTRQMGGMEIRVGMEVENDDVRFFVGSINDSHNLCSIDKKKPWTVKTTTHPMRKCMEQGNYSVNAALLRLLGDKWLLAKPMTRANSGEQA